MKVLIVCVLLVAMMVSQQVERADAAPVQELVIKAVISKIISLFSKGHVDVLGHDCTYRQYPQIRKWRLRHKAEVRCPTLHQLKGEAHTGNRRHALNRAVEDLVRKAFNSRYVTEKDAKAWLDKN